MTCIFGNVTFSRSPAHKGRHPKNKTNYISTFSAEISKPELNKMLRYSEHYLVYNCSAVSCSVLPLVNQLSSAQPSSEIIERQTAVQVWPQVLSCLDADL